MLHGMAGPFFWTRALFVFCSLVVAGVFLSTFFTVLYQRLFYKKYYRSKYDPSFHPRCSVIVPCKGGSPKNFEENLMSFLRLDYDSYEVLFAVESESDGAVPKIRKVIAGNPKASLVIAGLSTKCAQKNFNQLAAVARANDPDVYVFADVDISPRPQWLAEIILPLSNPKISVTTGFRWLNAERGTLGQQAHFYMNSFLYTLYSTASFVGSVGLWGGSMAIRKKDFDELNVAGRWSETVVDDSSLSQLIKKHRKKSILVPTCITHTDDLIDSVRDATRWFERQMMFLKLYQKSLWIAAMPVIIITFVTLVWLPCAAAVGLCTSRSFYAVAGGSSLMLLLGKFISDLMYPLLGTIPRLGSFMFFQPAALCVFLFSCIRTTFRRTIVWSGIKYYLSFSGKVIRLERL
ncbi:MAG TPA: glycosyltransferase family 2 protein [Chitinivibrionales bacterium]|nr:glycosyltransferase family 2 protein [Chitinivibrionales bacterium]